MNRQQIEDWIKFSEIDKNTLLEEKYDDAIVGFANNDAIIYDLDQMINIESMNKTNTEAIEYIDKQFLSKNLKTIFMNKYRKSDIDNHYFAEMLFNKLNRKK